MIQGNTISLSEEIQKQLTKKRFELIRGMFNSMSPFDIASALESSSPNNRRILWELVDISVEGEVLNELSVEVREFFLSNMDATEVAQVTEKLEADEIVEIIQELPEKVIGDVLKAMSSQNRELVSKDLSFAKGTA